jgi:hypothetical protein
VDIVEEGRNENNLIAEKEQGCEEEVDTELKNTEVVGEDNHAGFDGATHPSRRTPEFSVGTVFAKYFEGFGEFKGWVVTVPTDAIPYYGVKYEDGDEEDLPENELRDLVVPPSESGGSSAVSLNGRKSGSSAVRFKEMRNRFLTKVP